MAVHAGAERHPSGGGGDGAAHHASWRNQRSELAIQAEPVRHVPTSIAHDHDQGLGIQPGGAGMIVRHHQVCPRPVPDRSIERRGEAARRPAVRGNQPGAGWGVLGRVRDIGAQEGDGLAVR